jgi:hypothetical protein
MPKINNLVRLETDIGFESAPVRSQCVTHFLRERISFLGGGLRELEFNENLCNFVDRRFAEIYLLVVLALQGLGRAGEWVNIFHIF